MQTHTHTHTHTQTYVSQKQQSQIMLDATQHSLDGTFFSYLVILQVPMT